MKTPDECNLPPLWHRWANCSKKQEFNVLVDQLQAYSRGPDAFSTCAPVVSLCLVQDLLELVVVGETLDDVKMGLQPFIITNRLAEQDPFGLGS